MATGTIKAASRKRRWICQRRFLDAALIVPVAMSQDFREQSDGRRMGQNVRRIGTQQRFTAAKKHVHQSQPGAHVVQSGLVLVPVSYTHLRAHETDSYLVC